MVYCISISKPKIYLQDKVDEIVFNYKMGNDKQHRIKTAIKVTESALTITLLSNGTTVYASTGDKIINALNPLIDLIQCAGYPLAILAMSGGAITMMFNKRIGMRMIKDTAIAFLVLQFVPGLMKILLEVGRALR